jgi:hypothetical protein
MMFPVSSDQLPVAGLYLLQIHPWPLIPDPPTIHFVGYVFFLHRTASFARGGLHGFMISALLQQKESRQK